MFVLALVFVSGAAVYPLTFGAAGVLKSGPTAHPVISTHASAARPSKIVAQAFRL